MVDLDKILEGSYTYLNQSKEYSLENFEVWKKKEGPYLTYLFQAEILTRVSTGEFLKIGVEYVVNHHFDPIQVRIIKTLGKNKTEEKYEVDPISKEVSYSFQSEKSEPCVYKKIILGKFQIATPSFLTSFLMVQSKKIDPMHRTQYDILTSDNAWSYEKPFWEKTIYIELMSIEPVPINIGKKQINAMWYCIFENDQTSRTTETGVPFYISKHLGIPYKANFTEDVTVEISKLKDLSKEYRTIF